MATEFNFYLSDEDTDRLFVIKKLQGLDDLTGNDFAEKLLSRELYKLFPAIPDFDDCGNITNADKYKGR